MVPARLAFAGPATHRYCASLFCACRSAGELWSRRCRAAALVAHRCCSVVQVGGAGVCVSVPSRCIPSRPIYCSPARRHRILAAATRKNFRLLRTQQNRQQNVVARIPEQRNTRFYGIAFISWPPVRLSPELWPNRFHTARGHCGALWKRWRLTDSDLCLRGETQTMFHIVHSCPLTKLGGGSSRLHSAGDDAVQWLANRGGWTRIRKNKKTNRLCLQCTPLCVSGL